MGTEDKVEEVSRGQGPGIWAVLQQQQLPATVPCSQVPKLGQLGCVMSGKLTGS